MTVFCGSNTILPSFTQNDTEYVIYPVSSIEWLKVPDADIWDQMPVWVGTPQDARFGLIDGLWHGQARLVGSASFDHYVRCVVIVDKARNVLDVYIAAFSTK